MTEYIIKPAGRGHAPAIGAAVIAALGPEIPGEMAGGVGNILKVYEMFSELAARDDSQYSYRNTLVALNADGAVAGALVSYDGALLHKLREAFVDAAARHLGWLRDIVLPDETTDDEIYLDSLSVFEPHRGRGLASRLIEAAAAFHSNSGKPLGLLCDPHNTNARRLYERLGFREVGRRLFLNEQMYHMQKP